MAEEGLIRETQEGGGRRGASLPSSAYPALQPFRVTSRPRPPDVHFNGFLLPRKGRGAHKIVQEIYLFHIHIFTLALTHTSKS